MSIISNLFSKGIQNNNQSRVVQNNNQVLISKEENISQQGDSVSSGDDINKQIEDCKKQIDLIKGRVSQGSSNAEQAKTTPESFPEKYKEFVRNHPGLTTAITAATGFGAGLLTESLIGKKEGTAEEAKLQKNPEEMNYSDGIDTPLEVAFLPFADPQTAYSIINLSKTQDSQSQVKYRGELSSKDNPDNYEKIDYTMKGDDKGNVLIEGKYGTTEFKEEYTPDGAFSGNLQHFVKNNKTGEYVKDGEVKFRDMPRDLCGDYSIKGNVAGIPIEENYQLSTHKHNGKVGDLEIINAREKINGSDYSWNIKGKIGNLKISGDDKTYKQEYELKGQPDFYSVIERNIGDSKLHIERSFLNVDK